MMAWERAVLAALLAGGVGFLALGSPRTLGVERSIPPGVRLAGTVLALLAGGLYVLTGGAVAVVTAWASVLAAMADIVDRVIPHRWVLLLALTGVVRMGMGSLVWLPTMVLAAALGAFFLVVYIVLRGGIGLGDVKLATAMGIGLGWPIGLDAVVYGLLAGGLWGALLLVLRRARARDSIAFGPFLALGVLIALLVRPG